MREIKFEYIANKKDGDEFDWHKEVLTIEQIEKGFWQGGLDACFYSTPDNVYKRQFTGLKDKNGVEIYEGDIVIWENPYMTEQQRQNPEDYSGTVEMGTLVDETSLPKGKKQTGWIVVDCFLDSMCTVIGNIYQNPELIK